jgi:GntR family transcriptional regulator
MVDTAAPDDPAVLWGLLQIDGTETAPLYLQLAEKIANAIAARRLRQGQALPAERVLVERLGLSRTTIRKAVEELTARGLVASQHGSGTFVAARLDQPLARLSSFTDDMRARGRVAGCRVIERGVRFPSPDEAVALALSARDKVSFLTRVRLADGEPLALERAAVPARVLPDPATVGDSLYAALQACDAVPVRALQRLRATMASTVDAHYLGVAAGTPIMATVRYGYLADGSPVEFTRSSYRGDRYDFIAEMRREAS